jgi:hypothetical protein
MPTEYASSPEAQAGTQTRSDSFAPLRATIAGIT